MILPLGFKVLQPPSPCACLDWTGFSPVWLTSITIIQRFHPIRIQLQLCPTSSRSYICCEILLQLMIISLVQVLLLFITAAAASTTSKTARPYMHHHNIIMPARRSSRSPVPSTKFSPTATVNVTLPKHQSSNHIDARLWVCYHPGCILVGGS